MTPAALSALANNNMENFITAMTPGGIEAQEKRGQMEQAKKETLPVDLQTPQPVWEAVGFVFGERSTGPDIFRPVTFPAGWKKVPTDHDMWSDIVDEKGQKRGAIFYKAAFYDRSAHAYLDARFHVGGDTDSTAKTHTARVRDARGLVDKQIVTPQIDWDAKREEINDAKAKRDAARAELTSWLDAEYPDWRNVTAYWD